MTPENSNPEMPKLAASIEGVRVEPEATFIAILTCLCIRMMFGFPLWNLEKGILSDINEIRTSLTSDRRAISRFDGPDYSKSSFR